MAMIRDDFENLSDLMEQQKTPNNGRPLNIPKIDRIILYIDDLDRCPPKRVVEVLRAIHLILAFPLFMVVVGVDSRWLSRSLKDRYPFLTLRDGEETNKNKPESYSASTQDYLEKIFQVPYWLKSIDQTQVWGLLQDIVEDEKEQDSVDDKTDNQENEGAPTQAIKSDDSSEDEQAGYTEQEYEQINQEDLNLNPRALTISENELTFMGHVGGFIGSTPRTVKRFVNIYRILKVSDIRSQRINFTEKSGGFRYPMLLLAILTGQPESGHLLFKCLHKAEDSYNLSSFLQSLPETIKNIGVTDKASWEKFLALFTAFTAKHGTNMTVKELKEWLPQVTRYGYRELQI
jgi:hypothetical protein